MSESPIVVIDGPRGVGKTTTARRLAQSTVSLPEQLDRLQFDAAAFLAALPKPALIDEWQLAGTDLLWTLKRLVDRDPTPGQFILTGSVEPATYGPTYPLIGRATRLVLRPFTVAEQNGVGHQLTLLDHLVNEQSPPTAPPSMIPFSLELLGRSGFPAAFQYADPRPFLESYASMTAERAGAEGRDASRLLRTLRVLATLESEAVPDRRIWEAADINKATWKSYEDLLTRTHLNGSTPAFSSNRLKRLTSYPKRYFADVAMALALADLTTTRLESQPSVAGHYFGSFVVQQLRTQADSQGATISHVRTGGGEREVDILIEVGNRVIAFEVKLATRIGRDAATSLEWLRDQLDERFLAGLVVYAGADTYPIGDRVWAMPVSALWAPL